MTSSDNEGNMQVGENIVQNKKEETDMRHKLNGVRIALHRLALETRAERMGLTPQTCFQLAHTLNSHIADMASDLGVPPETLAKTLLSKWRQVKGVSHATQEQS